MQKGITFLFAELILVLVILLAAVVWMSLGGSDDRWSWIKFPFRGATSDALPATPLATGPAPEASATPERVPENHALEFEKRAYIQLGVSPDLALTSFTLETWFNRSAAGSPIPVGDSDFMAVPLITRGWGESGAQPASWNYFLGIGADEPVLVMDYVEGEGQSSGGMHHTITGTLPIGEGIWYHVAVTFDGEVLKLYLDGNLEKIVEVGKNHLPVYSQMHHTALAASLNASGEAVGFFAGMLDETRLWDHALSQAKIQSQINQGLATAPGLVGRWGFDEGAGYVVNNTAGPGLGGIVQAYTPQWMPGAPFNLIFSPPYAPKDLVATAASAYQVDLTWRDQAWNETAYEVERFSLTGNADFVAGLPMNTNAYQDTRSLPGMNYCYRLRAVNLQGESEDIPVACVVTPPEGNSAISLGGDGVYISIEDPPALDLRALTIEAWIRWTGFGRPYSTGDGGVAQAIPLLTYAGFPADGDEMVTRWMLGIEGATGVLAADFEDRVPGQHHPVYGSDAVSMDTWHHVAATYDGNTWRLYLDGQLEAVLQVGIPLQDEPGNRLGLGIAPQIDGSPLGLFQGDIDEVRVWNHARTHAQILAAINTPLTNGEGLVMRWGFGEGEGSLVRDSMPDRADGWVQGGSPNWLSPGAPFDLVVIIPPDIPTLLAPANGTVVSLAAQSLQVKVDDVNGQNLQVTFYGRLATLIPSDPFTLVTLPDTQNYTLSDAAAKLFQAQSNWIVNQQNNLNIQMVNHLGDITENGSIEAEWQRASQAMAIFDQAGVRSGIIAGNHDMADNYAAYKRYFPPNRYQGSGWYGGYLGDPNDGIPDFGMDRQNLNNYQLFSVSGMDFIVINLEIDPPQYAMDWAAALLQVYVHRWAVITTHVFIDASGSRPTVPYVPQAGHNSAETVWQQLIYPHCNIFLVLGGHYPGEARRIDSNRCGEPVYQLLQDYQDRAHGGDGWLRYLVFEPFEDEIEVYTYSPSLDKYEEDANSRFKLDFPMAGSSPFREIGTITVPAGSQAEIPWSNLIPGNIYEWYVVVSDGQTQTSSATWRFTFNPQADGGGSEATETPREDEQTFIVNLPLLVR